jgi:putative membrane protein
MKLILIWLLNAIALLAVAYLVPGIHVAGFSAALVAALMIGLVNMFIRPILVLLTLPITLLTLGLFILVINGVLFYFVAKWIDGFDVTTLAAGIIGALAYSVLSWLLSAMLIQQENENN